MKLLAIVHSTHIGNTMQIAEAMAEIAPLTIAEFENADKYNLSQYDAVGFGGGINAGSHDEKLLKYVQNLETVPRYSFVFSTSATGKSRKYNAKLIKLLESRGSKVLGSFGCKGLCKFFIFALVGGVNKGRPNTDDFDAAQSFIEDIMKSVEREKQNVN